MDYDAFLRLVKNRRSTRRFKPDPISDEVVDKIIEAARWAPSGFNLQPWEFVVVKDRHLRQEIVTICGKSTAGNDEMERTRERWQRADEPPPESRPTDGRTGNQAEVEAEARVNAEVNAPPASPRQPPGGDYSVAPVFVLCCGDTRTNAGLPMGRRYSPPLQEEAFKGGLASAFLYMHLAAATLGLASRWVSSVCGPYAQCMIKDLLGIPPDLEIYDMMALGYGATVPGDRFVRKREEMVHYDRAPGSYRTDEQVKAFVRTIRAGR